jgi:alkanesulfonate monooxygenase SsuD/methylene tetrahydromethanopterin reductase-like flavin-dependent oxidoreductase (luciferase family)
VPFAERGARTDAAIDAVVQAWTTGAVDGMHLAPRPAQRPRPPIWIGGSGPAALRRVAARGDGWIPQGTPRAEMPAAIEAIRRHRDRLRPAARPELGVITELVHVGPASWDLPRGTVSGPPEAVAESLNAYGAMGVAHLQVRFATRSAAELAEQVERFGTEVGPLLCREVDPW